MKSSVQILVIAVAVIIVAGSFTYFYENGIGTQNDVKIYAPGEAIPFHNLTRIVSLLPSITANIYALGAWKDLVGISTYTSYPSNATLPIVASLSSINNEELLNLSPQAVITIPDYYPSSVIDKVIQLGIPVIEVGQNNFSQIEQQITVLGQITGTSHNASKITGWMNETISSLRSDAMTYSNGKEKSVFYLLSTEGGYWTAGNNTFINDFFNIANLKNIANGSGYYTISSSLIIKENPQVVILDQYVSEDVMNSPPMNYTAASASKSYYTIFDDNYFNEPDFRSVYAVQWLIDEVYNKTVSIENFPINLPDNPAPEFLR
ncbi:MAG: ABC transporter substrate-binding protein [Thermoplasmata archaeon]